MCSFVFYSTASHRAVLVLGLLGVLLVPLRLEARQTSPSAASDRAAQDSLRQLVEVMQGAFRVDPPRALAAAAAALALLERHPDAAREAEVLCWKGWAHAWADELDDVLVTADRLMALAQDAGLVMRQGKAEGMRGEVHLRRGEYAAALEAMNRALEYYNAADAVTQAAWQVHDMGVTEIRQGAFDAAYAHFMQALTRFEQLGNEEGIALTSLNIGNAYNSRHAVDEALAYYRRALDLSEKNGDTYRAAEALASLSDGLRQKGQTDEALAGFSRALALHETVGNARGIIEALSQIGGLYAGRGDYAAALDAVGRALDRAEALGDRLQLIGVLAQLGAIHQRRGAYDEALAAVRRSRDLAEAIDARLHVSNSYEQLAAIHEARGAYADALAAYKQYKAAEDSLFTEEREAVIAELQTRYRSHEQQQRIALLERDRQLQQYWLVGLVGGLSLLAFIAFLVYSRYRSVRQARAALDRAHGELQQAHEALKTSRAEVDRMKARFFANISHEFRTPLTLILGQIAGVLAHAEGKDRERLRMAARNGQRLHRLIDQLLDLSRLEAGGMVLRSRRADLIPFLKSLIFSFDSLAEQRRITLHIDAPVDALPLYFEAEKLEQVFYNLLSNAFKFTPEGGAIGMDVRTLADAEGAWVEVSVHDTGIGIPPDRLPHVFDRFYQVGAQQRHPHEGTGIGLALARELVVLHHGTISVRSTEGAGTTFAVRLPLDDAPPADAAPAAPAEALRVGPFADEDVPKPAAPSSDATPTAREIVLIVEDNADVRAYLRDHLDAHYQVVEAVNGDEGLARAKDVVPDLVVSDVMMPCMDGYTLCRRLRADERTSHIPIIILTARAAQEDRLAGLETGVDDYLVKPFSPKELRARVRNLIDQRRRLRERFSQAVVIQPSDVSAVDIDRQFLTRVLACIEAHLADADFGVDQLAERMHLSVSQLNRKLNALVDQPAGQVLRSMRLKHAADLLARNAGTVTEISDRVGFSSPSSFSRSFKAQFGCAPTEYVGREA